MARSVEGSSRSSASVDEVWAVWTDPGAWFGGPIEAAELHGTFAVGSKYTTKLKGYSRATATITRIESPRLWTSVVGRRTLTVTVGHVVEPAGDETLLTERWIMSGPLGPVVARLLAWRIRSTQVAATAHLARIAEARAPTSAA
jgi:Polyketide cyclase / dehydrase and lipid transport